MVGQLIKTRRLQQGLSQTQLADRVGSSQRYVSDLENNRQDKLPRKVTREKFGAVLGITETEWYRAAGILPDLDAEDATPPPPSDVTVQTRYGAITFDRAKAIAYVESKPDHVFQEQLARAKQQRSKAAYERWLLKIYVAWSSNADLAVDSLDLNDVEHEV